MDMQNKELCRRIDLCMEAARNHRPRQMLDFLDQYMIYHFQDEEILHKASGYPNAARHQEHHESAVAALHGLRRRLELGDPPEFPEISASVGGIVRRHIIRHDQEFAQYFKNLYS